VLRVKLFFRRVWLSLILAAVLVGLLAEIALGPLGPGDLLALRRHQAGLLGTRNHLLAENASLKKQISELRSDDAYLQRLIRRELGYVRSDELVYRFSSSAKTGSR
jgi:cell division protein FtsB